MTPVPDSQFSSSGYPSGKIAQIGALLAALLLVGCDTVSSTIFPSAPGSPSAGSLPSTIVAAPQAGSAQFLPNAVSPGEATGTAENTVIATVRNKLIGLQGRLSGRNVALSAIRQGWTQDVAAYRVAKNQVLRPAPQTDTRSAAAQGDAALKRLGQHSQRLQQEMETFAQGNAESGALMVQLDGLSTNDDQDRRQLNALRGDIAETSSLLDTLVNALSTETAQNSAFLAKEKASLAGLAQGTSASPAQRASEASTALPPATGQPISAPPNGTKPAQNANKPAFVTIVFDRPSVTYREALAAALKQALKRRPDAAFDVVGVTAGEVFDPIKLKAEDVSRTMMELGVNAGRIGVDTMRVRAVSADEVRIFVR